MLTKRQGLCGCPECCWDHGGPGIKTLTTASSLVSEDLIPVPFSLSHTHTHTSLPRQAKRRALGSGCSGRGKQQPECFILEFVTFLSAGTPCSPPGLRCHCSLLLCPHSLLGPLSPAESGQDLQKERQKNQRITKGK